MAMGVTAPLTSKIWMAFTWTATPLDSPISSQPHMQSVFILKYECGCTLILSDVFNDSQVETNESRLLLAFCPTKVSFKATLSYVPGKPSCISVPLHIASPSASVTTPTSWNLINFTRSRLQSNVTYFISLGTGHFRKLLLLYFLRILLIHL